MAINEMNFVQLLQAQRRGEIVREADELLAEMVQAIHEHGGKGDITLKLSVKKNDAEQLEFTPTLKMNKPRRSLGIGIFYATESGRLSRTDPNQDDIFDELTERRGITLTD